MYGYRQYRAAATQRVALAMSLLWAAVGILLGILTGTSVAAIALRAERQTQPQLVQASYNPAGMNSHPVFNPVQSPAPDSAENNLVSERPSPRSVSLAAKTHPAPTHHARRMFYARWRPFARHGASLRRASLVIVGRHIAAALPVVAAPLPVAAPLQPADNVLRLNEASKPTNFIIQGDATVADYDATLGMITTDEGKNFVIDKTAGASAASSWEDYHSNVHYRCDGSRTCTLTRGDLVVHIAMLTR